ncbi:MAG: hypothetical protein ACRDY1_02280, partial [Acidimicrobiales bacterium]
MAALTVTGVLAVGAGAAGAAGTWTATVLPPVTSGPPGTFVSSPAVSCPTTGFCLAVGSSAAEPDSPSLGGGVLPTAVELTPAGADAVVLPLPSGGADASLSAVSCVSDAWCAAVGQYEPPGGGVGPLLETFSDGTWTASALPGVRRAYFASLSPVSLLGGIACTSSTACVAVGVYPVHTGRTLGCCYRYHPLIESLSGTTWTPSTAPTPPEGADGSLSAVSCSAPGACVAVGNVTVPTGTDPLAETLTRGHWRAATLPLPAGASLPAPYPWSVSCVAGTCTVVGAVLTTGDSAARMAETG